MVKKNKRQKETNENSVSIALNDLMSLEDERRNEEEAYAKRIQLEAQQKQEEQRKQIEEARRLQEAEEKARLLEKEKELLREKNRLEMETQEQKMRIKAEYEMQQQRRAQQQLLDFEMKMKEISKPESTKLTWLKRAAGASVALMIATSIFIYLSMDNKNQDRFANTLQAVENLEKQTAEQLQLKQYTIDKLERDKKATTRQVHLLKQKIDDLENQLVTQKAKKSKGTNRSPAKTRVSKQNNKEHDLKDIADNLISGAPIPDDNNKLIR